MPLLPSVEPSHSTHNFRLMCAQASNVQVRRRRSAPDGDGSGPMWLIGQ
jgi:hypothetical protein